MARVRCPLGSLRQVTFLWVVRRPWLRSLKRRRDRRSRERTLAMWRLDHGQRRPVARAHQSICERSVRWKAQAGVVMVSTCGGIAPLGNGVLPLRKSGSGDTSTAVAATEEHVDHLLAPCERQRQVVHCVVREARHELRDGLGWSQLAERPGRSLPNAGSSVSGASSPARPGRRRSPSYCGRCGRPSKDHVRNDWRPRADLFSAGAQREARHAARRAAIG